jgi:hypothetical protein
MRCFYQKDERAQPGNLHNRKYKFFLSDSPKCSLSQYFPTSFFFFFSSLSLSLSILLVVSVGGCSCEKWEAGSWDRGIFGNPKEEEPSQLEAATKQRHVHFEKTLCVL